MCVGQWNVLELILVYHYDNLLMPCQGRVYPSSIDSDGINNPVIGHETAIMLCLIVFVCNQM